jgi:hypothetical protein
MSVIPQTILLLVSFSSFSVFACDEIKAFENSFKALIEKYPEYKNQKDIFTIKDQGEIWLFLRKQSVFKAEPREYPRVVVNKRTCLVERVLWSK